MEVEIALLGVDRAEMSYAGYARQRCELELALVQGHIGAANRGEVRFPPNPGPETVIVGGFQVRAEGMQPVPGWMKDGFPIPVNAGFVFRPGSMGFTFVKDSTEPALAAVARLGSALEGILDGTDHVASVLSPEQMIDEAARAVAEYVVANVFEFDSCSVCGRTGHHDERCELGIYLAVRRT